MKPPTITITRAEYDQLNKAANAAIEHAINLFKASRMVEELEVKLDLTHTAIQNAAAFAAESGDYKKHLVALIKVVKPYQL
jgi:hypothetical protein